MATAAAATAATVCLLALSVDIAEAEETIRYRVEISLDWSAESFPLDYPADAHFSPAVGIAHDSRYVLFRDGDTASSGLGLIATNGRSSVLEAELAEARRRGPVADVVIGKALDTGTGAIGFDIELSERHPQLSVVTMLAPSPDWFVGDAGIALHDEAGWIDHLVLPLWVWDAGVDDGPGYNSPDSPVQPRQSVRLSAAPSFLQWDGLKPIGRLTMSRIP